MQDKINFKINKYTMKKNYFKMYFFPLLSYEMTS